MSLIQSLLLAGVIAAGSGCDPADGGCGNEANGVDVLDSECSHVVGVKHDPERNCLYPNPVYVGCFQTPDGGPTIGSFFLSPDRTIYVYRGVNFGPVEPLLQEGWTPLSYIPKKCDAGEHASSNDGIADEEVIP